LAATGAEVPVVSVAYRCTALVCVLGGGEEGARRSPDISSRHREMSGGESSCRAAHLKRTCQAREGTKGLGKKERRKDEIWGEVKRRVAFNLLQRMQEKLPSGGDLRKQSRGGKNDEPSDLVKRHDRVIGIRNAREPLELRDALYKRGD